MEKMVGIGWLRFSFVFARRHDEAISSIVFICLCEEARRSNLMI